MLCSGKRFLLPSPNLVALITMMGFLVANITAYATELGTDYSSNSEMELIELTSGGDYRNKSINVTTLNGETLLTVTTDGEEVDLPENVTIDILSWKVNNLIMSAYGLSENIMHTLCILLNK